MLLLFEKNFFSQMLAESWMLAILWATYLPERSVGLQMVKLSIKSKTKWISSENLKQNGFLHKLCLNVPAEQSPNQEILQGKWHDHCVWFNSQSPLVSKFNDLSIRGNFGCDVSVHMPVRSPIDSGGGGGESQGNLTVREENAIFWKRGFFKSLICSKTIVHTVLNLRKNGW